MLGAFQKNGSLPSLSREKDLGPGVVVAGDAVPEGGQPLLDFLDLDRPKKTRPNSRSLRENRLVGGPEPDLPGIAIYVRPKQQPKAYGANPLPTNPNASATLPFYPHAPKYATPMATVPL